MRRSFQFGNAIVPNQLKLAEILMREGHADNLKEAQNLLGQILAVDKNNIDAIVVRGRVFEK
jgi:hypothetical protein